MQFYDEWYFQVEQAFGVSGRGPDLKKISEPTLRAAHASGISPREFAKRQDLWAGPLPSSQEVERSGAEPIESSDAPPRFQAYADWLNELKRDLSVSRPDITVDDLDPNGCYAAWKSGQSPTAIATGIVPLKGAPPASTQPRTSPPPTSPSQKRRPQPMPTIGWFARMHGLRVCRCPSCSAIVYYKVGTTLQTLLLVTWGLPKEIYCADCDSYFKPPLQDWLLGR